MAIDPNIYWRYANAMPQRPMSNAFATGLNAFNIGKDRQAQERELAMREQRNALAARVQEAQLDQIAQQNQRQDSQQNFLNRAFAKEMSPVGPYRGGMNRPSQYAPMSNEERLSGAARVGLLPFDQYLDATAPQDPYEGYSSTPQEVMLDGQTMLAYTAPGRPTIPVGRAPQRTPLVEVNTGDKNPLPAGPGNKKFLETTGTLQANRLDELTKQAQSSMERQYGIQVQRANIEQGLQTGAFAPLVNAVASYADGLGINPESLNLPDPTKGQVFNVATFDNLLKALQAQKGPQTEGDAERALKTFASLKNTEEANMFILDYMDAIATRTQDMAEFVDNAAYGKYASSNRPVSLAEKEFRQWARQTPLVAKSKKTGLPITYYEYKKAAIANGIPEGKVDQEWRKFAGVK